MSNSRPSSSYSALPPPVHSLCSCTSSGHALPLVPLPLVLDITLDLTLVKSTSNPYLSCSNLVPLTYLFLLLLHCPCISSSPCLLPLWFIFLSVSALSLVLTKVFTCHCIYSPLVLFTITKLRPSSSLDQISTKILLSLYYPPCSPNSTLFS